jgi:hypothetical protein
MSRSGGYESSRPASELAPPPPGAAPGTNSNTWRHASERAALVERVIAAERANRLLEAELRARIVAEEKHLAGNPDVAALMEENRELRQTIERLNSKILRRRAS